MPSQRRVPASAPNAVVEEHEAQHPVSTGADKKAQIRETYRSRIEELREYGEEDGISLDSASEEDLYAFLESLPGVRRASLVLTDEGHLRAVWRDEEGSHLGLRFLGDRQQVEYVIFRRLPGAEDISRVAGLENFDGIHRQISSFQLNSLLNL